MMQAIWEIYVETIGAILMTLLRIAMFLADHGAAGVAAGFVGCVAVIVLITAIAYKLG